MGLFPGTDMGRMGMAVRSTAYAKRVVYAHVCTASMNIPIYRAQFNEYCLSSAIRVCMLIEFGGWCSVGLGGTQVIGLRDDSSLR